MALCRNEFQTLLPDLLVSVHFYVWGFFFLSSWMGRDMTALLPHMRSESVLLYIFLFFPLIILCNHNFRYNNYINLKQLV